ncbi:hypothetical protein BC826DRAFT_1042297, partial [Russula brevipes]
MVALAPHHHEDVSEHTKTGNGTEWKRRSLRDLEPGIPISATVSGTRSQLQLRFKDSGLMGLMGFWHEGHVLRPSHMQTSQVASRRSPHGTAGEGWTALQQSKYLASLRSTHARTTTPFSVLRSQRRLESHTCVSPRPAHHVEIARRKLARARLQREVRMTERLLAQVIQAVLVMVVARIA